MKINKFLNNKHIFYFYYISLLISICVFTLLAVPNLLYANPSVSINLQQDRLLNVTDTQSNFFAPLEPVINYHINQDLSSDFTFFDQNQISESYLDDKQNFEPKLDISGTKTFVLKKADVKGDHGHFATENYESIPGFRIDQSLHLEIHGNITQNASVSAVLDDKEDEERKFTININSNKYNLTMGDFSAIIPDTEFIMYKKEVRGIMAWTAINPYLESILLFSQTKGFPRREQFRGAGNQQEFRLQAAPIVPNSENIRIDNKILTRGNDYIIDYDEGIVKFLPHLLPLEITNIIVIEYEVKNKEIAFKRNFAGIRFIIHKPNNSRTQNNINNYIGISYIKEYDINSSKNSLDSITPGATNSANIAPTENQILAFDAKFKLKNTNILAETSFSNFDPNTNDDSKLHKSLIDNASKLSFSFSNNTINQILEYKKVGKNFVLPGREKGILTIGERGLTNDIYKLNSRTNYLALSNLKIYNTYELSKTNLENNTNQPTIKHNEFQTGGIWNYTPSSKLELRYSEQDDFEVTNTIKRNNKKQVYTILNDSNLTKSIYSQTKVEKTILKDSINLASDTEILAVTTNFGGGKNKFKWQTSVAHSLLYNPNLANELTSKIINWGLDMNLEPFSNGNIRGIFQCRNEFDYLSKVHSRDFIADSRTTIRKNDNFELQLKYKVENTLKVIRDPSIDPAKYNLPPTLSNHNQRKKEQILSSYETPARKSTINLFLNYQPHKKLETFIDLKNRNIIDRRTNKKISENSRNLFEVRYTPSEKLKLSSELEYGISKSLTPQSQMHDNRKNISLKYDFIEGFSVTTKYEIQSENDMIINANDKNIVSNSLSFQRIFSERLTFDVGLKKDIIKQKNPFTEFGINSAITFNASNNCRYRFFINHTDILSTAHGKKFEHGLDFNQNLGTDTSIDGEIKKIRSTPTKNGNGYNAFIANAKIVVNF